MTKFRVRISIKYNDPIIFYALEKDADRIIDIISSKYEVITVYKQVIETFKLR